MQCCEFITQLGTNANPSVTHAKTVQLQSGAGVGVGGFRVARFFAGVTINNEVFGHLLTGTILPWLMEAPEMRRGEFSDQDPGSGL